MRPVSIDPSLTSGSSFYRNVVDNFSEGVYCLDHERRITYWNRGAELITGYTAAEVVGSKCRDNILEHVDTEGRQLCGIDTCPAVAAMADGQVHEHEVFLKHKDGHRVPVLTRVSPILDDLGRITGAVEIFSDNSHIIESREHIERLQRAALLDAVTGVGNRRFAEDALAAKLAEQQRYGWGLGVAIVDVDHFKLVNDQHGHETGDRVLKMIARTLVGGIRSFDRAARWGGDEFLVVLTNLNTGDLSTRGDALRRLVASTALETSGDPLRVTISIGAAMAGATESPKQIVQRADRALYQSKKAGRNRFSVD